MGANYLKVAIKSTFFKNFYVYWFDEFSDDRKYVVLPMSFFFYTDPKGE